MKKLSLNKRLHKTPIWKSKIKCKTAISTELLLPGETATKMQASSNFLSWKT